MAAAVTPAPVGTVAIVSEEVSMPICYRLEVLDVLVHAGPSIGQPPYNCSLSNMQVRSAIDDFDFEEIWRQTVSGLTARPRAVDKCASLGDRMWASQAMQSLEQQL